jgi:hypothetical protein
MKAAISSLLHIKPRYMRSTNIERDIDDRKALDDYLLTPHAQECLGRLAIGLGSTSTQRAWRLTGDYRTGEVQLRSFCGALVQRKGWTSVPVA